MHFVFKQLSLLMKPISWTNALINYIEYLNTQMDRPF